MAALRRLLLRRICWASPAAIAPILFLRNCVPVWVSIAWIVTLTATPELPPALGKPAWTPWPARMPAAMPDGKTPRNPPQPGGEFGRPGPRPGEHGDRGMG